MRRIVFGVTSLVMFSTCLVSAQDDDKLISGPRPGAFMPGSFESMNVNGDVKGKREILAAPRPRCLVCQFALSPSVLVFTREPEDGKDGPLKDLVKQLDELAAEFTDRNFSVGVIFLSPDARDSSNNAKEEDAAKLIKEAVNRDKLVERLKKRAEGLKHVIIAGYPVDGPKEYKLNPKAEATVLYYDRMKVIENWTYAPGKLQAEDVEAMVKNLREALENKKKKGAAPGKA